MAGFADINASVNAELGASQSDNNEKIESQSELAPQERADDVSSETESAIAELEKIEKFKFQGKEYTPKELGTLLAREKEAQKAFTQKTQALAEERKSLESERKYYDNLAYDLMKVRENPALAKEFISVYPEKFHNYLRNVLSSTSQAQNQEQPLQRSEVPVELMSKVQQLENFVQQQEVSKAEVEIERDLTKALSNFKYASRKEVLADVYEFHNQLEPDPITGRKPPIPAEIWTKAAEASHNDRMESYKAYQKDFQQQQK